MNLIVKDTIVLWRNSYNKVVIRIYIRTWQTVLMFPEKCVPFDCFWVHINLIYRPTRLSLQKCTVSIHEVSVKDYFWIQYSVNLSIRPKGEDCLGLIVNVIFYPHDVLGVKLYRIILCDVFKKRAFCCNICYFLGLGIPLSKNIFHCTNSWTFITNFSKNDLHFLL